MTSSSAPSGRRWLAWALVLTALPWLSGCLVIEKKTLVMVVPPDSREVRMYYVFEGLSCLNGDNATLDRARRGLDALKKDDLSFFIFSESATEPQENPLLKQMRFEPLRFYTDPARQRTLCADRKVTIVDRKAFAQILNDAISDAVRTSMPESPEEALANIKELNKQAEQNRKSADEWGMGPLVKAVLGLALMAEHFDKPSLKRIKESVARESFPWIEFEPEALRLTVPVTGGCARRIAEDPLVGQAALKELRTLVEPIDLDVNFKVGRLSLVLGAKGKPIRLTYPDGRANQPDHEADMLRHVDHPRPLKIGGKPARAEQLIEQFVREATKKP